jgi:hypothetical protein
MDRRYGDMEPRVGTGPYGYRGTLIASTSRSGGPAGGVGRIANHPAAFVELPPSSSPEGEKSEPEGEKSEARNPRSPHRGWPCWVRAALCPHPAVPPKLGLVGEFRPAR